MLFAVALAAVLAVALWPLEVPVPLHTGWDKADHVAAFAALGLLGMAAWPRERARVFAFLLAYGAAIELLQGLSGYRQADWRDFVADGLGVGLAWAVGVATLGTARR